MRFVRFFSIWQCPVRASCLPVLLFLLLPLCQFFSLSLSARSSPHLMRFVLFIPLVQKKLSFSDIFFLSFFHFFFFPFFFFFFFGCSKSLFWLRLLHDFLFKLFCEKINFLGRLGGTPLGLLGFSLVIFSCFFIFVFFFNFFPCFFFFFFHFSFIFLLFSSFF